MEQNPNEKARKMAEDAQERLSAELEAGRSDALKNYMAAAARFRHYSWRNILLITSQRPEATRIAGIHTWNDLGRTVKPGEKGIAIFAPVVVKQPQEPGADGKPPNEPFRLAGFRTAYVFDVSQTEGKALPEFSQTTGNPKDYTQRLQTIVAKRGIELEYDKAIAPAQGISTGGRIRLLPGLSGAEEFSVLAHELAHEMLHHKGGEPRLPKVVRETQAEAVAYVVCQAAGLENNHAAADYIALYQGDKRTLGQSLSVIQETAAKILDELLPEGRTTPSGSPDLPVRRRRSLLNVEGFGKIHRDYRDRLIHSITGFVRDRDRAEDIASQAFGAAWEKRAGFRGEALPYTWLQTIARNAARQSVSRERTAQFDSMDRADAREIAVQELLTDELEKRDDRFRLQQALDRLPIKHRRALVAHFIDGLSIREVARRERVPSGTVLSRIFTGKQLLRKAWEAPLPLPHADVKAHGTPSLKPEEREGSRAPGPSGYRHSESPEPATRDR